MSNQVGGFLEHHGVLGMHWGKHKAGTDSGSSGPARKSRSELRALDKTTKTQIKTERKAAEAKAIVTAQKSAQKATEKHDNEIYKARGDLGKTYNKYADAKKQYKVDKHQIGKVAAKVALKKHSDELQSVYEKSIQETSREATSRALQEAGAQLVNDLFAARGR